MATIQPRTRVGCVRGVTQKDDGATPSSAAVSERAAPAIALLLPPSVEAYTVVTPPTALLLPPSVEAYVAVTPATATI